MTKGGQSRSSVLSKGFYILLEVPLQQALQGDAVTGLVTGHLVDGLQNAAFQAANVQGRGWLFYLLHEFARIIDTLQQT